MTTPTPPETHVLLANGWTLASRAGTHEAGLDVTLYDPAGRERGYWDNAEWARDPQSVMGAIIRSAADPDATVLPADDDTPPAPWGLTDAETVELADLETVFEHAGGRGVEDAERIDELRTRRDTTWHRTVLTVEVLTRDAPYRGGLEDLWESVSDGDASGTVLTTTSEQVGPDRMARLLVAQGSDPEFLGIDTGPRFDDSEVEDGDARPSVRYVATFAPEAWIDDQAVGVDPQGPTTWDATTAVLARPVSFVGLLADDDSADGPLTAVDNDDVLKDDPRAPRWVRDWTGPSTVRVTCYTNGDVLPPAAVDALRRKPADALLRAFEDPDTWDKDTLPIVVRGLVGPVRATGDAARPDADGHVLVTFRTGPPSFPADHGFQDGTFLYGAPESMVADGWTVEER